jgi:hypothetical protein
MERSRSRLRSASQRNRMQMGEGSVRRPLFFVCASACSTQAVTSLTTENSARTHDKRLLIFVVCSLFVANVLQSAVCRALHLDSPGNMKFEAAFTHLWQGTDSWLPMMKSLDYFCDNPTLPIYGAHLYDTLIYSLVSELPLLALKKMG